MIPAVLMDMPEINGDILAMGLAWYAVFVFSTVLHEAAHALVAHVGGDDTAAQGGQVGLNPLPHMQREPVGMVLVPWISFFISHWMMGWASAPYDPTWAAQYPKRAARMALAGPAANFLIALVTGVILRVGLTQGWFVADGSDLTQVVAAPGGEASALTILLSIAFTLNLLLGAFNLLPLPPLDGAGVVGLFMSDRAARRWQELTHNPQWLMVGMMAAWLIFYRVGGYVLGWGVHLLYR
ncbi:MAG TPA: site-2 protease family protein [Candidatus Xenobia bacterium]|jgi:Zn-dependent protease